MAPADSPDPTPTCPYCNEPLSPGVRFCESCGKPVGQTASPREAPGSTPEPVPPAPHPETPPVSQVSGDRVEANSSAAALPAGGSRNLIIAGIVVLVVLAAVAFFVVLPMFSAPAGASPGAGPVPPGDSQSPGSAVVPGTSSPASGSSAGGSFTVKPTSLIPANYMITYQAERNGITGLVTVTFAGGPGMNGIRETTITLTKSDGTVETKSWKPKQNGDSTTLQGTIGTDHLEAVANFYNGDQYRVLDQIFEYKKKN